ncbi:MAG TPA: hypothetical protein ENL21_01670 [Caldithrix abyssi]|uniref:Uncharacterized protein n=1 Tax=Caldithrix abyssi TaxID=187145 RepID=A0A7V5LJ11_CALAY|nr:hypothetical protein [Caldisericaceae bacterium]HHE54460.1 hypothetical protein [Caldithrix abyssi]
MDRQTFLKQFETLQSKMRVLILQHRSESEEYDEDFLIQMHNLSARMIWLRKQLKRCNPKQDVILPLKKDLTSV